MDTNRPATHGSPGQPAGSASPAAPSSSPAAPPTGGPSKIQHSKSGFGRPGGASVEESGKPAPRSVSPDNRPLPVAEASGHLAGAGKITTFGKERRHEDSWSRTPNTTGSGAIHVKTFHCKLTEDALQYMDQNINEWLDAHPQYEVKFVSSTIGVMTGKLKEPALYCQVWV